MLTISFDISGPVNVPSHHGLRYSMSVIDHHTHYMWVQFLKSKDDTRTKLENVMLELRHFHARHHSPSGAFAPVIKFDSDFYFEAAPTRHMCASMDFGVQFSAPYPHHILGKAERP
jgi:hypothetical protein